MIWVSEESDGREIESDCMILKEKKTMEVERIRQLSLLWCGSKFVALVGANHTAARFCAR